MKPTDGKYQAATKVKKFSPEIINVGEVDSIHKLEDSMIYLDMVRDVFLTGSKTVVWYCREVAGTW